MTPVYNSCRDRHCPTCQSVEQARWLEARRARILSVPYFHVVFTLPAELRPVARYNPEFIYALLFRAASEALLELCTDPERLGALPAITAVLHTWARDLSYHVHLHCIVSAGGLSLDGVRWVPTRSPRYLAPVRVLAALFRGKFLAGLFRAHAAGRLRMPADASDRLERLRDRLYRTDWHVYAKRLFGGAEQVYAYLGRYTHRVGISNARLESLDAAGRVTFRTRNGQTKTLLGESFLARFLAHVLPHGFVKVRHYGLLAASNVATRLQAARATLTPTADPRPPTAARPRSPQTWLEWLAAWTGAEPARCPHCKVGAIARHPLPPWSAPEPRDTS